MKKVMVFIIISLENESVLFDKILNVLSNTGMKARCRFHLKKQDHANSFSLNLQKQKLQLLPVVDFAPD